MTEAANISVDDTILVEQCRQGDSAAMQRLILKYQNRIYNTILKICANPDDAAELAQETFVKVIENIDKFQGRSSFYTWVFRIAVNLTLNYCKRSVKLGFRSLDAEDDEHDPCVRLPRGRAVCRVGETNYHGGADGYEGQEEHPFEEALPALLLE